VMIYALLGCMVSFALILAAGFFAFGVSSAI